MVYLSEPLTSLKGIGEKTGKLYEKLGIINVSDLLLYYPKSYMSYPALANYDSLQEDMTAALYAKIKTPAVVRKTRQMDITLATGFLPESAVELIWYRMPYIRSQLHVGESYVFYGKIQKRGNKFSMQQPQIFTLEAYHLLMQQPQPIYGLTKGLSNSAVTKLVRQVFEQGISIGDYLPVQLRLNRKFQPLDWSMHQMHFPDDFQTLIEARRRLAYEEFLFFFLETELNREDEEEITNDIGALDYTDYDKVRNNLPFELTEGQKAAMLDVISDITGPVVSQRLIQGDVGSGKTIVAFLSMLLLVSNGCQAAIMAPTEVLARQHAVGFEKMLSDYGLDYEVVLLVGSMKAKEKREALAKISENKSVFIVGTHALIQEKVIYNDLKLVITDEQHRFGVKQRQVFSEKGQNPHVLIMSATPIPRTLAKILYGNMNLSVIADVPARSLPIKNAVIRENARKTAYNFIGKEVLAGHQAYVICPLVENTETTEAENVTEYAGKLRTYFGGQFSVGLLHGRMSGQEKNEVMEAFSSGKIQILVSTTVVEVGVNVPNATVMMIENANRFGLAQLHQLRGRVGRGDAQSYCIFVDSSEGEGMSKRLEILKDSNDGFAIAEADLKMRGPGDYFGIRQSGDMGFEIADIYQDAGELQMAAEDAKQIIKEDPHLQKEENRGLLEYINMRRERVYLTL